MILLILFLFTHHIIYYTSRILVSNIYAPLRSDLHSTPIPAGFAYKYIYIYASYSNSSLPVLVVAYSLSIEKFPFIRLNQAIAKNRILNSYLFVR